MVTFKRRSCYAPENERIRPLKRDYFNRKYIFQPLIFRGHVSFPGCKLCGQWRVLSSTQLSIMNKLCFTLSRCRIPPTKGFAFLWTCQIFQHDREFRMSRRFHGWYPHEQNNDRVYAECIAVKQMTSKLLFFIQEVVEQLSSNQNPLMMRFPCQRELSFAPMEICIGGAHNEVHWVSGKLKLDHQ